MLLSELASGTPGEINHFSWWCGADGDRHNLAQNSGLWEKICVLKAYITASCVELHLSSKEIVFSIQSQDS